jgi:hypothetical protein
MIFVFVEFRQTGISLIFYRNIPDYYSLCPVCSKVFSPVFYVAPFPLFV